MLLHTMIAQQDNFTLTVTTLRSLIELKSFQGNLFDIELHKQSFSAISCTGGQVMRS